MLKAGVLYGALVGAVMLARADRPEWMRPVAPDPVPDYEVFVNGVKVGLLAVETAAENVPKGRDFSGWYWAASFPVAGPSTVVVRSPHSLERAAFLPADRVRNIVRKGANEVSFAVDGPFRVSLERTGRTGVLHLFGEHPEGAGPQSGRKDVVRFGPGVWRAGRIDLTAGQTLYLDRGARVYGTVVAKGDDITIAGPGILSGGLYPRGGRTPGPMLVVLSHCRRAVVRDVTLTAPFSWTMAMEECDGVTVENVKILASRMLNDDAVDICNCRNVAVRDCFIRAQDDLIAVKGRSNETDRSRMSPCEDILVENCDLWSDMANVFRIGFESNASVMRRLTARNLDVLHYSVVHDPFKTAWPHAIFWLQPGGGMPIRDMLFEDIRVHCDGTPLHLVLANPRCTRAHTGSFGDPTLPNRCDTYQTGGSVSNCVFRNVSVVGKKAPFLSVVQGRSETETVSDLSFENVTLFGRPLDATSPDVHVGKFASAIRFDGQTAAGSWRNL